MSFKDVVNNVDFSQIANIPTKSLLKAGGYIIKIYDITDNEPEQYLTIKFDINVGEYKNYYHDFGKLAETRIYYGKSQVFLKNFLVAVISSKTQTELHDDNLNQIVKNISLSELVNLCVGGIFGTEKYTDKNGNTRSIVKLMKFCTINDINNNNYDIPQDIDNTNKDKSEESQINENYEIKRSNW